ncbi:MAG: DUF302 domain-containing protein [Gemmatimonadetes bacterium]|nr:DUF302 domain-containing protein [Gemmatimonadota bacterium]
MTVQTSPYGFSRTVPMAYDAAVAATRAALATEGFGIITEADVRATFKAKLNAEFRPYIILGACNPNLAKQALEMEPDLGLLLPCNVVVYAAADPAQSVVAMMDPVAALGLTGNAALTPVATEVKARLERALATVGAQR